MFTPAGEALLRHLADGRFHSGQALAAALNLSRTAVWKQIRKLADAGIGIQAVGGRGYRLAQPLEWLDREAILSALEIPQGCPEPVLEIHTCLSSTNTHLLRTAQQRPSASVCLAEVQTAGRGRLGRGWVSPFGCGVCLSLLWRFREGGAASGLSLAAGVAVVRALEEELGLCGLRLKWPNDILWRDRKLGGILIEAVHEYQGDCVVVVGLGLNLWLPPEAAAAIDQPWVDLHTILGRVPSRNRTVAAVLGGILALLHGYEPDGLEPWLAEWRRRSCVLGRPLTVAEGGETWVATAVDVTREGCLLLEGEDGRRRVLAAGEVKLRLGGG